jgi:hypothetical protein
VTGLPLLDWAPAPARAEPGWEEKALGRASALRLLLSDFAWHGMDELRAVAGWRYGARLLEARRGTDGGEPFEVEKRREGNCFFYRMVRR